MADPELSKKKKKRSKEEKKKKKRKRSEDDNVGKEDTRPTEDSNVKEEEVEESKDDTKKKASLSREEYKAKKAKKKAEKEELMKKVPKTDEHGIAYTKAQIKRMTKRVKRGLDPVPTEEEERERLRQIKIDKREEELELAGMLYNKEEDDKDDGEQNENEGDGEKDNENQDEKEMDDEETEELEKDEQQQKNERKDASVQQQQPKKKPRSKAVPSDYVCAACKNSIQPLHWIYDCTLKESRPGTNQVKKRLRGIHDPSSRKVFISGLPFEAKTKEVEMYFEKEMKCGKVLHCKLLQFEDTKRCKGSGFLTFETDEGAKNALKLNGTTLDLPQADDDNSKHDKGKKKQKELRLAVKKLLNRTITKRSKTKNVHKKFA